MKKIILSVVSFSLGLIVSIGLTASALTYNVIPPTTMTVPCTGSIGNTAYVGIGTFTPVLYNCDSTGNITVTIQPRFTKLPM